MVPVLAVATTRSKSTGHTTAYLLSATTPGALHFYQPARRVLISSHVGIQDTLTNMMSVNGTTSNERMQEAPHASADPLIFHHLRVGAEATALTLAFVLLYDHDQGAQPARASDLILQLCLHRRAQQKKTHRADAPLTE